METNIDGLGKVIKLTLGSGRSHVNLHCIPIGTDYQVIITGGAAHIGAVGLGVCYDARQEKANSSVLALFEHREDDLVKATTRKLSKSLKTNVAVTAGIHYKRLTKPEIQLIYANVDSLLDELIEYIIQD